MLNIFTCVYHLTGLPMCVVKLSIQLQIVFTCMWCDVWETITCKEIKIKTVFSIPHCISRLGETVSKFSVADSFDLLLTQTGVVFFVSAVWTGHGCLILHSVLASNMTLWPGLLIWKFYSITRPSLAPGWHVSEVSVVQVYSRMPCWQTGLWLFTADFYKHLTVSDKCQWCECQVSMGSCLKLSNDDWNCYKRLMTI